MKTYVAKVHVYGEISCGGYGLGRQVSIEYEPPSGRVVVLDESDRTVGWGTYDRAGFRERTSGEMVDGDWDDVGELLQIAIERHHIAGTEAEFCPSWEND